MSDVNDRPPGAAPRTPDKGGQEPAAEDSPQTKSTTSSELPAEALRSELEKTRAEAAKERHKKKALRDRLKALEAEREQAEEARLAQQQQFKTLAEQRKTKLDETIAELNDFRATVHQRLIDAAVGQVMTELGITDEKRQRVLLRAAGDLDISIADDLTVAGSYRDTLVETIDVLGLSPAKGDGDQDDDDTREDDQRGTSYAPPVVTGLTPRPKSKPREDGDVRRATIDAWRNSARRR